MSIATRIESISNHIEQAYDELQGLGADLTNVNKNIENISMVLDDIYNSMPQVSGEGTSLTLDNTRVGKIKSTLKGNTSQDGTPTPTSPIPVNVVSGDNKINIVGKNFLENRYLPIPSADTTASYTVKNAYLPEGTYTLATTDNSTFGNTIYIKLFKEDKQVVKENGHLSTPNGNYSTSTYNYFIGTANNLTYIQFTIDDNYYVRIGLLNSDNTKEVMLVKGSEIVRTYEPYQGNTYNIDLPVKNDFALPNADTINGITYSINDDSTINLSGTATANATFILYKDLADSDITNGDTYTFFVNKSLPSGVEIRLEAYNNTSWLRHILNSALNSTTQKITNSANLTNATRVRYHIYVASGTSVNINNLGIQLEKGSKQNNFTPYGTTPIELCKIGNYQDYIYKDNGKWYKYGAIGKVVKPRAGWSSVEQSSSYYRIALDSTGIINVGTTRSTNILCTKYNVSTTNNYDICFNYSNRVFFYLSNGFTTKEQFLTTVDNNFVLYFPLATPTNEEITYQPLIDQLNELEKAMSKDGQTNISQVNNDLPFIIKANALLQISD